MRIVLPLLGVINKDVPNTSPLRPKYVVKVTAEEIATFLKISRKGKKKNDPYKIDDTSIIKIDKKIQRGTDEDGFLGQQPAKISEISRTLLGDESAPIPRIYLGAMVWNIRPEASKIDIITIKKEGYPDEHQLQIVTENIFLTDSAHRHLGIVEAYTKWKSVSEPKPKNINKFSPEFEFLVEIYNLSEQGEKELFSELNSKQKKITASKSKEMDVSTPIGALKDAIQSMDADGSKLLSENIEVRANQNQHTLMTMSVFVSTIEEMFSTDEIKNARYDDGIKEDLALQYCTFLTELNAGIKIEVEDKDKGVKLALSPFYNLYSTYVKPAVDSWDPASPDASQTKIDSAWDDAARINRLVREQDITNSNPMMKAWFYIGGLIKYFSSPKPVITYYQQNLNNPASCRFMQATNQAILSTRPGFDIPIATLNQNGSLNIQVQSKTIQACKQFLREQLRLIHPPLLSWQHAEKSELVSPTNLLPDSFNISRTAQSVRTMEARIVVPKLLVQPEDKMKMKIRLSNIGNGLQDVIEIPTSVSTDEGWTCEYEDLVRRTISFEIKVPIVPSTFPMEFVADAELNYPDFDGEFEKATFKVRFNVGE